MPTPALPDLLQRHAGVIRKVVFAYGRDAADRDELQQEIAVQIWRSHGRFAARSAESTWVYRIALNVAISWFRRERRHRQRADVLDPDALAAPAAHEPSEAVDLLRRSIDAFGPLDRALVLLHLDGHDHAAIAEVLGISVSNVGTRLSRVRQRLREVLAPRLAPEPPAESEPDHGTR